MRRQAGHDRPARAGGSHGDEGRHRGNGSGGSRRRRDRADGSDGRYRCYRSHRGDGRYRGNRRHGCDRGNGCDRRDWRNRSHRSRRPGHRPRLHSASAAEQVTLSNNVLNYRLVNGSGTRGAAQPLSTLANYPGTAADNVVDVSEAIQHDTLYVDVVTAGGHAAELTCTLSGGSGLDNGATPAVACNSGTPTNPVYWVTIPFP